MRKILIATNHKGKIKEIESLLKDLNVEVVSPEDEGLTLQPRETGQTFKENALIKARAFARASGLLTLADDSGLEVDALSGFPGVRSARWMKGIDEDYCRGILKKLKGVPKERRAARFRVVVAIVDPRSGKEYTCEGIEEGEITFELKGSHGFGYDPIFFYPPLGKTNAEMTTEEKNKISHRGKALLEAKEVIKALI